MNFIVIMLDTLRADHVGAYGQGLAKTPNLDRFAASAMRFDKAYCGSFATIPNRNDLFTGRHGDPFHMWLPLSYMEVTLPEVMRKNGYAAQLINDTPHLINYGFGFDRPFNCWWMIRGNEVDRCWTDHHKYKARCDRDRMNAKQFKYETQHQRNIRNRDDAEESRFCAQVMTAASRWLQDNRKREKFFLWVDCFDPHEPWDPPQHYIDLYDPGYDGQVITNFFNPDTITPRELQHIRARYAAKVTMVDAWLGRFLDQIERTGHAGDTTVAICSDHGTTLGDHYGVHKRTPIYEEVGHIVWMMRVPGMTQPNSSTKALVQPADLMPTLLDVAGIEAAYDRQGFSLKPVLKNPGAKVREAALSGFLGPTMATPSVTVNDGEWTYVLRTDGQPDELYRMASDPLQKTNVAEAHPREADRLREELFRELERRNAPAWLTDGYRTRRLTAQPPMTELELRMAEQRLNSENFLPGELEYL